MLRALLLTTAVMAAAAEWPQHLDSPVLSELKATLQKYSTGEIVSFTPNSDEREAMKQDLDRRTLIRGIPGLRAVVEKGLPRIRANKVAGIGVEVFYENGSVRFVSIYVPILNLRDEDIPRMWEALYEIVEVGTRSKDDVRRWLPTAVRKSFDAYVKGPIADQIVEGVFNRHRVVVWGVPPDMWQVYIFAP